MIQTAGVLRIATTSNSVNFAGNSGQDQTARAAHKNAVKWLKQPNLKAEVKRALVRSKGLLKGDRIGRSWLTIPKVVKFMTHKQLKAELGKQLKRLS